MAQRQASRAPGGPLIRAVLDEETELMTRLAAARADREGSDGCAPSFGARIADKVAATVGSWPFIIAQSGILLIWIVLNITAYVRHWDPYPFILLNLALSFQAAYAAPFIMMSQNRQAAIDRRAAEYAYDVDIESELEIELLHKKLDAILLKELPELTRLVQELKLQHQPDKPK